MLRLGLCHLRRGLIQVFHDQFYLGLIGILVLYVSIPTHESLFALFSHLFFELLEVLVLKLPGDLLIAHVIFLHVFDQLFVPHFASEVVVII